MSKFFQEEYVLGFLLCDNFVLLMRKTKPEWQKGKFNGIGGKVEEGESPSEAMIREAEEEAGLGNVEWVQRGVVMYGKKAICHVFSCKPVTLPDFTQKEEGKLSLCSIHRILKVNCVQDLDYLVPLCCTDVQNFIIEVERAV